MLTHLFSKSLRTWALLLVAGLVLAVQPALRAQDDNGDSGDNGEGGGGTTGGGPALADKTRQAFMKMKPLLAAKDYNGVMAVLDALEPTVKPDSYDLSVILDTKAKILWQGEKTPQLAIDPWERLLAIVDRHPEYLDPADRVSHYQYLAQTYYLVASEQKMKNSPLRRQYFDRAIAYMKRWLQATTNPRQDDLIFYTELLYTVAIENPAHVDKAMLEEAKVNAHRGLMSDAHPKEAFYMVLVAIAQQQADIKTAADLIQLLVTKHPTSKDYWTQLVGIYSNLAGMAPNSEEQRSYYARAINAAENAQRLGFLNTPKDNFNLVSMYDQVGQFGKAIELLYAGMKHGKIESTLKNWQVLAYFYQQIDQPDEAIKVLKEAEDENPAFGEGGEIDRQIATLYYQEDNTQGVYDFCKKAVAKGNQVKQPFTTYQYLAYAAYELRKYDEALAACETGLKLPDAPVKDLKRLKEGIVDAMKQQAAEKAAAESERRSL